MGIWLISRTWFKQLIAIDASGTSGWKERTLDFYQALMESIHYPRGLAGL